MLSDWDLDHGRPPRAEVLRLTRDGFARLAPTATCTARWLHGRWRAPVASAGAAHAPRRRALARRAIPDDLWKRTLVRYPFLRRRDPADDSASCAA